MLKAMIHSANIQMACRKILRVVCSSLMSPRSIMTGLYAGSRHIGMVNVINAKVLRAERF